MSAIKEGKVEEVQNGSAKVKKRLISVPWEMKGHFVFLWKEAVANERSGTFIEFSWDHVLSLILGIILGFFGGSFDAVTGCPVTYSVLLLSIGTSSPMGLGWKLGKQYVYIFPGKPWQKILAITGVLFLKDSLRISALIVPIVIIVLLRLAQVLAVRVFWWSADVILLSSEVVVNVSSPFKKKGAND